MPARCVAADARGERRPHDGVFVDGTQALQVEWRKGVSEEIVNLTVARSEVTSTSFTCTTGSGSMCSSCWPAGLRSCDNDCEFCNDGYMRYNEGGQCYKCRDASVTCSGASGPPFDHNQYSCSYGSGCPSNMGCGGWGGSVCCQANTCWGITCAAGYSKIQGISDSTSAWGCDNSATCCCETRVEPTTSAPTAAPSAAPTKAPTATPTASPTPPPTQAAGPPNGPVSAIDDPHLVSLSGEKFDVNMPGSYVLIRAPKDLRLPAKLEVNATLRPFANDPCRNYIQSMELSGEWLADQVVRVLPLKRNVEGSNSAGNTTLRPFSMRVQGGQAQRGNYEQWGDFRNKSRGLSGRVRLEPEWRQVYADAGRTQEAQAFQFRIRGAGSGFDATLEVAQAAHQALNFRGTNLKRLGFDQLGGLLGTEVHDGWVEQVSDLCKATRAMPNRLKYPAAAEPDEQWGPSMAASWD